MRRSYRQVGLWCADRFVRLRAGARELGSASGRGSTHLSASAVTSISEQVLISRSTNAPMIYEWQPDPSQEASPEAEAIAALVMFAIVAAAVVAAPHLKRLWRERAVPAGRRLRRKLSRSRTRAPVAEVELDAVTVVVPAAQVGSQDVIAALAEYRRATMSTAEARDRLVAALVARMFSDHQLRVLRDIHIGDDDQTAPLLDAVETLTPAQLAASLQSMLALEPSSPESGTLSQLFARLSTPSPDRVALPQSIGTPNHGDEQCPSGG